MSWFNWSQTASSNAGADPTINWAEGQAPSSINDSARAMMAATAKYRDDIAGAIVTGGSSTAYTVASYSVFDTLAHLNGQMIAFSPHATNGAGPVLLNVDGLGQKPLRSAPNVELLAGTIIAGTPYVAVYNNSDGAFYLQGVYGASQFLIPVGAGLDWWAPSVPNSSFALAQGQAISRATYATLFSLFGTTYGVGDGSTTFNIPDKVGRVSAMLDAGSARISSAFFGGNPANLGASGGRESNNVILTHSHANALTDPGHAHPLGQGNSVGAGVGAVSANPSIGFINGGIGSSTTGITITNANAGSASAHNIVQPTIVCNYILRII